MEFNHHFYKKLEEECNKRFYAQTNCKTFTTAFGKMLETHLDRVMIHRKLLNKWLTSYDVVSKDEIAAISIKVVDYQEKLDFHDESLYLIYKRQEKNRIQLAMVRKSYEEVLGIFAKEVKELHECKIKRLEKDLLELKQLFI